MRYSFKTYGTCSRQIDFDIVSTSPRAVPDAAGWSGFARPP